MSLISGSALNPSSVMVSPSMLTLPSAINLSAARRLATPASAINLFNLLKPTRNSTAKIRQQYLDLFNQLMLKVTHPSHQYQAKMVLTQANLRWS